MTNTLPSRWTRFKANVVSYFKDILHLLRLDFYRALKDKSVLIISIISTAYALFYVFLGYIFKSLHITVFTARDAIVASTQLSSMPFLLIGIMLCIFIGKDLNYGTIRNKIIAGYSKKQIYVSTLLVVWIMTMLLLVLFQVVCFTLGTPLIGFPTGAPYSDIADFWIRLGLGYLLVTLAVSVIVFVEMVSRNMVTALLISTIVFVLGPLLMGTLIGPLIVLAWGSKSLAFEVFECFFLYDSFVISSGGSTTGLGFYTPVEGQLALKTLISSGISVIALNWLGVYGFHKVDLK